MMLKLILGIIAVDEILNILNILLNTIQSCILNNKSYSCNSKRYYNETAENKIS